MSKFKPDWSVWPLIETLFREEKRYRGDNAVRLVDLEKMLDAIIDDGDLADPNTTIDPNGGAFSCKYKFDPKIWGKWFPSQDTALSMAAMDKDVTAQYAGRSQGYTAQKTNWGGKIVASPGKARGDFERMPSAMDRYDILMQGDITSRTSRDKKTGELKEIPVGNLLRVAYSPSIGSTEERKVRLLALMSGQEVPGLKKRVQPHVPEPTKKEIEKAAVTNQPAGSVRRVGQNVKFATDDDDDGPERKSLAGGGVSHFSSFLSKHAAEYQPRQKKPKTAAEIEQDAAEALFPPEKKKK